jgi:hypothetical protein
MFSLKAPSLFRYLVIFTLLVIPLNLVMTFTLGLSSPSGVRGKVPSFPSSQHANRATPEAITM